jgi:hypothetical protein
MADAATTDKKEITNSVYLLAIYVPGLGCGMVGLVSLVREFWKSNPAVRTITYAFGGSLGGLALITVGIGLIIGCRRRSKALIDHIPRLLAFGLGGLLAIAATGATVLGAFYSDWILGAIAGDLTGVPSGDNAILYWSYFAIKRLPIVMM